MAHMVKDGGNWLDSQFARRGVGGGDLPGASRATLVWDGIGIKAGGVK